MSILIGAGVITVVTIGYLGRKGWHAFHRAVGITPGTMTYTPPEQLPPPVLVQLNLTPEQQQHLPLPIRAQLNRIDQKADTHQNNKDHLNKSGHTLVANEDDFIVQKLLSQRLPDMLDSYQRINRHEQQMRQTGQLKPSQAPTDNWQNATQLLAELLNQIENKLDTLLETDQQNALQDMQVMSRYLEDR